MKLSCIIPFCREYPQNMFTIKNIAEELRGRVDFEILAVDNYCDQAKQQTYTCKQCGATHQTFENDKGGEAIKACERMWPWLKYVQYGDKLSHWNAKNYGVKKSTGDILWFCDAHCIIHRDSLFNMFEYYINYCMNGTLHLPLTYKILEAHRTIYKPVFKPEEGLYHYTLESCLTSYKDGHLKWESMVVERIIGILHLLSWATKNGSSRVKIFVLYTMGRNVVIIMCTMILSGIKSLQRIYLVGNL